MSQSRLTQPDLEPPYDACQVRAPRWVTEALIADTIRTWQPYYDTPLTEKDAIEMLVNVGQLFDMLEADHAQEKNQPNKST